jgi:hypothetical protein
MHRGQNAQYVAAVLPPFKITIMAPAQQLTLVNNLFELTSYCASSFCFTNSSVETGRDDGF